MTDFVPSKFLRTLALVLMGGASVSLSACATSSAVQKTQSNWSKVPALSNDASVYALFMAGQKAINSAQSAEAAKYFARAQALDTSNIMLAERTFTTALLSGDVSTAAKMAAITSGDASTGTKSLGQIVRAVDAMGSGNVAQAKFAYELLSQKDFDPAYQISAQLLLPYAAAMSGDWDAALAMPSLPQDRFASFFATLNQALLMERHGRIEEATKAYQTLMASGDGSGFLAGTYGSFLERQGRQAEAMGLYDAVLAGNPSDPTALDAKLRLTKKNPAPALPTLQKGAAATLMASAIAAVGQHQPQGGMIYMRLALRLDPSLDEAWVLIGDLMTSAKDRTAATAAYEKITPASSRYGETRNRLAWGLQRSGDAQGAIKMAEETAKVLPNNIDCLSTLADLLRTEERFAESIVILDRIIAIRGETAEWGFYFMRGIALERSAKWPAAEADLKKALDLNPNEPEIMNYLGYSWIDRGEHLTEGLALIKNAVEKNPQSGAMVDSLGWAYYRLGDFKRAAEMLEQAVQMEAADPDVNNHLGDAYWRVGRKVEAQYQWSRVLTLMPTVKMKAEVEAKLKDGLPELSGPAPMPLKPDPLPGGGTPT
jgi:tetratricopeptide (TPR) repeat protein